MTKPVRSAEVVVAVIRHAFLREATHRLDLAPQRLDALADSTRDIGVRALRYPTGYHRLPELVGASEGDLASG